MREVAACGRLHREEDVAVFLGRFAPREKFAEIHVVEHVSESVSRLKENFLAVRDEKEILASSEFPRPFPIVEGRDHRLSRSRRRDDERFCLAVQGSCSVETLENRLLEGIGFKFDPEGRQGSRRREGGARLAAPGLENRLAKLCFVARGVKAFEALLVRHVGLEDRLHALEKRRVGRFRHLDGPLETVAQRRLRKVGASRVGGREAVGAMEKIGLCVVARRARVVGHEDFGVGKA